MKIAQLMHSTVELENKKRAIQRRETTEAYRKTAQYQSPKNPMLEALENLLSGKTEKELNQVDDATREQAKQNSLDQQESDKAVSPKSEKLELPESKQTAPMSEQETDKPEQTHPVAGGELPVQMKEGATSEETLAILERVRTAALAPAEPSPQDLRVATQASSQMQEVRGEASQLNEINAFDEDIEPFLNIDTKIEVPERFLNDFSERDANATTVFGRDLENLIYNRTFSKATSKYSQHIAMVKNGYRSFDEPSFSKTA